MCAVLTGRQKIEKHYSDSLTTRTVGESVVQLLKKEEIAQYFEDLKKTDSRE